MGGENQLPIQAGGVGAGSHPGRGLARNPTGLPAVGEQREKDASQRPGPWCWEVVWGKNGWGRGQWLECHLWVPLETSPWAWQLAAGPPHPSDP